MANQPAGRVKEDCPLKKGSITGIAEIADPSAAGGKKGVKGVKITLYDGDSKKGNGKTKKSGIAKTFSGLELKPHRITAELKGKSLKNYNHLGKASNVTIAEMAATPSPDGVRCTFTLENPNVVTPILSVDKETISLTHPIAPATKKEIHLFQPKFEKEEKQPPKVVTLNLSYEETNSGNAFDKGLTLTATGAEVALWKDKKCEKPIKGQQFHVPHKQAKKGQTIYLTGVKSGEATFTLEAEASSKAGIEIKGPASKQLTISPKNRVTPYLKVEHLVVLRDLELWKDQRKNDTLPGSAAVGPADHIKPDPTRIELSVTSAAKEPAYTGKGKLSITPANVETFEDEACTTAFDLTQEIEIAKLTGTEPLKLWLRGKTAGKFKPKLTLSASSDARIKVDPPAEGEMGCVELKMKLHHYKEGDVNKAINPDVANPNTYWDQLKNLVLEQAEMTQAERIGTGRILHAQKDRNHSRAKLIVEKVDGSQWPDAAKDYSIVLNKADGQKQAKTNSGSLKLYTIEEAGASKALPHKIKLSDAKTAEETFWIEGSTECDNFRDIRLSLGFDRPDGGPPKTEKKDGNWASFTVIKIKEVKIDYTPPVAPAASAWDKTKKRFYINLKDDVEGRKIVLGAALTKELKGIPLRFMLAPDKENKAPYKDHAKAAPIKHKDRSDPKKLLHFSAETDDKGYSKTADNEVLFSRYGGDKFVPSAYQDQDPHLAKYVHGHTDLEKRKPAQASDAVTLWRKMYFQITTVAGLTEPSTAPAVTCMDKVFIDFEEDIASKQILTKASLPTSAIVDGTKIRTGSPAETLVVGDQNVAFFKTKFQNNKSPTAHIIYCHEQLDADNTPYNGVFILDSTHTVAWPVGSATTVPGMKFKATQISARSRLLFEIDLKDGTSAIKRCKWKCVEDPTKKGTVPSDHIVIDPVAHGNAAHIKLPAGAATLIGSGKTIKLSLKIAYSKGWYNGWCTSGDRHNVIRIGRADSGICGTIVHECGHAIQQAAKTSNPFPGLEAPPHQRYYTNARGHQGPHCADGINAAHYNDATKRMDDAHASGLCSCIMYGAGSNHRNANLQFCDKCAPYVRLVEIKTVSTP